MSSADTIFALATPPGKSGVAVLRLSGTGSLPTLKRLTGLSDIMPRHAHYVTLRNPKMQDVIDRGLALYFEGPNSFTGEDVVEFQMHGSLAAIKQLLSVLATLEGLRPAEPGEFTRRAFTNGKMDLMEAEGLADLIDAETSEQKSQAMRQMQGELSGFYNHIRERIIQSLAHLEAYIDFPDEDIPESVLNGLSEKIMVLRSDIRRLLQDERQGERLRDGINVVILGAPNAGKSSLLNVIAKRDVAIVSHQAGTTRDAIEVHLDMCGYPVVLIDTAGIRSSHDEIEAEGIKRALARAESADIKLVLFDGGRWPNFDTKSLQLIDDKSIMVVNKCDVLSKRLLEMEPLPKNAILLSAATGEGIESLLTELEGRITRFFSTGAAPFITRSRHRALLNTAYDYLGKSMDNKPLELKCEELRLAAQAAGKITGKIQVDDVLDVIFRSFCIGK